jgi:hypothetical protein
MLLYKAEREIGALVKEAGKRNLNRPPIDLAAAESPK